MLELFHSLGDLGLLTVTQIAQIFVLLQLGLLYFVEEGKSKESIGGEPLVRVVRLRLLDKLEHFGAHVPL